MALDLVMVMPLDEGSSRRVLRVLKKLTWQQRLFSRLQKRVSIHGWWVLVSISWLCALPIAIKVVMAGVIVTWMGT